MRMAVSSLLQSRARRLTTRTSRLSLSSLKDIIFPDHSAELPANRTVRVSVENKHLVKVALNRPAKGNAMSIDEWEQYHAAFRYIDAFPDARACIIYGEGKHFSTGMDLSVFRYIVICCG